MEREDSSVQMELSSHVLVSADGENGHRRTISRAEKSRTASCCDEKDGRGLAQNSCSSGRDSDSMGHVSGTTSVHEKLIQKLRVVDSCLRFL